MVITKDMPVSGIVNNWEETKVVFEKYGIPIDSTQSISEYLFESTLDSVILELNHLIGSSDVTCVKGG